MIRKKWMCGNIAIMRNKGMKRRDRERATAKPDGVELVASTRFA